MQPRFFLVAVFLLSIFAFSQRRTTNLVNQHNSNDKEATQQHTNPRGFGQKQQSARPKETIRPEEVLIRTAYAKMSYADELSDYSGCIAAHRA
jgi:AICAR transformylase/IMP cyclohydrolase PurH